MPRVLTALSLVAFATLSVACDQAEDENFRSTLDVDISMTMADGGDEDGTVVWELGEGAVFDGPMENGVILMTYDSSVIRDTAGNATCTIKVPFLHSNVRQVVGGEDGPVLFTVWRNFVLEGEVELASQSTAELRAQALFEFDGSDIYLGDAKDDFRLMSTNVNLESQRRQTKLLMAALLTGECGSSGLPGYF